MATTGRKVFCVEVEVRKTTYVYVEADSAKEAEEAVEADDLDAYTYEYEEDPDVDAREVQIDKLPQKGGEVAHGVLDGEVCKIIDPDYQARFGPKAEPPPPPPDTVTLPLFPERGK